MAEIVRRETVKEHPRLVPFVAESMWDIIALGWLHCLRRVGPPIYAFIIRLLSEAGVEVIATYNADDFRRLVPSVRIADPTEL